MDDVLLIAENPPELRDNLIGVAVHQRTWAQLADLGTDLDVAVVVCSIPGSPGERRLLEALLQRGKRPSLVALVSSDVSESRAAVQLGAADLFALDVPGESLAEAVLDVLRRRTPVVRSEEASAFSGVSPDKLPRAIAESACTSFAADGTALRLLGGDHRLHLAVACGISAESQAPVSVALGEGPIGAIALSGQPAVVRGALGGDAARDEGAEGRSTLVLPLKRGEQLFGVLTLERTGFGMPGFVPDDVPGTTSFVAQAVMALENVHLLRQAAAEEGMAAVGRIAAAVSHEINNPAGWVISSLNFLREELDKPKVSRQALRDALNDAMTGMLRIRDIVSDFKTLSLGESVQTVFDLSDAIRSASRVAGAVLMSAAIDVGLQEGLMVVGNRSALSQAFVHLILNAGAEKTPGRRITLRSRFEDNYVVATVSDSGTAVPEAQLARLFDPTFGEQGARFAGLGLSISRDIVSQHGGELMVQSKEGEGTLFTVMLPVASQNSGGSAPGPPLGTLGGEKIGAGL